MKKILLFLSLILSLSLFSQDKKMIYWGNGNPEVIVGSDITGSFLKSQKGHNWNVIISDTCTGKKFVVYSGSPGRPITYFETKERNIWIEYNNWFVKQYLLASELQSLMLIETTVNNIRSGRCIKDPPIVNLIIEGLIWRATHIINSAYNRYLMEEYGFFTKSGDYKLN